MPEVTVDKPNPHHLEMDKPQLRMVDLNLLTVFDAVMQEQNITRAAHALGMSQPAVSNAVARLKVMFNDELFVRYGRGIQPTARAFQLFGSVRQALALPHGEAITRQQQERIRAHFSTSVEAERLVKFLETVGS